MLQMLKAMVQSAKLQYKHYDNINYSELNVFINKKNG